MQADDGGGGDLVSRVHGGQEQHGPGVQLGVGAYEEVQEHAVVYEQVLQYLKWFLNQHLENHYYNQDQIHSTAIGRIGPGWQYSTVKFSVS